MTTVNSSIIQFPTKTLPPGVVSAMPPPMSIEDVDERINVIRQYHVEETTQTMIEVVFHNLMLAGFNVNTNNENLHKDIFMFVESLKSLLLKTYSTQHPLQTVADIVFQKSEDGTFKLKIPEVVNQ